MDRRIDGRTVAPRALVRLAPVVATCASLLGCGEPPLTAEQQCDTAVYRLADGRLVDVGPSDGKDLRWRLDDGRTGRLRADRGGLSTRGWTDEPDAISVALPGCVAHDRRIEFRDGSAGAVAGTAIPLVAIETTFTSHGTALRGRLVLPPGDGPVPLLIPVHGSERDSALRFNFYQRLLPAQGIAVFVYDKRGTGGSKGRYTQDFDLLADDTVAAIAEARRLAGPRATRVGLQGTSQGGWIAPLAATRTKVDFVIVDFGLAGSVTEENRDQVVVELSRLGYPKADLEHATEVADATSAVLASHFKSGFEQLDAVRSRYRSEPWFKQVHGQFAGEVLKHPTWLVRLLGPIVDVGTPIDYDAMAVLRRVDVPMLWILAGDDTYAPNTTTQARLKALAAAGSKIDALLFPGTEHGIIDIGPATDGSRPELRYAAGYFQTTIDYALHGRLIGPYGSSIEVLRRVPEGAGGG